MEDVNLKDALGNKVQVGQDYGYVQDSNGFCTVIYGKCTKITESGKVSLSRFFSNRVLYNDPINEEKSELQLRNISGIKPIKLFPIKASDIKYNLQDS
jgi:hypothetical protein